MNRLRLLVLVAGCGAPGPTLVVPLEISWDGDFELLVYDASGAPVDQKAITYEFTP